MLQVIEVKVDDEIIKVEIPQGYFFARVDFIGKGDHYVELTSGAVIQAYVDTCDLGIIVIPL